MPKYVPMGIEDNTTLSLGLVFIHRKKNITRLKFGDPKIQYLFVDINAKFCLNQS